MHSIPDRRMTYLQSVLSRRPRFVILWLGNDGNGRGTLATVYGATRRQHTAVWRWDKRPWETSSSINVHFRTESNTSWHSAANMDSPLAAPHVSSEASKHLRHESHDTLFYWRHTGASGAFGPAVHRLGNHALAATQVVSMAV